MIMNQATAMEMLRKEGFDIPVMMVDGQPQEMLSLDAYFRLQELMGTPFTPENQRKLKEHFSE